MRDRQEVVTKLTTVRNDADTGGDKVTVNLGETKSKIRTHRGSVISDFIFFVIIHALDALFMIILLPCVLWQWASSNDRVVIILKAIVEVTLELIMWIVFAGASILMTVTFVLEDIYLRKNDPVKLNCLPRDVDAPSFNNSSKNFPDTDTQNCATAKDTIKAS